MDPYFYDMHYRLLIAKLKQLGILNSQNKVAKNFLHLLWKNPDVLQSIVEATCFLQYSAAVISRIRCVVQGVTQQPLCKGCGFVVKMRVGGRFTNTFPTYCSSKCSTADQNVQNKRKSTFKAKKVEC